MMDYSDFEDHYVGEYLVPKTSKKTSSMGASSMNSRKMAVARPQVHRSFPFQGRPSKTLLGLSMVACTLAVICVVAISTIAPRSHKAVPSPRRNVEDVPTESADDSTTTSSPAGVDEESTEATAASDEMTAANETVELLMNSAVEESRPKGADRPSEAHQSGSDTSSSDAGSDD